MPCIINKRGLLSRRGGAVGGLSSTFPPGMPHVPDGLTQLRRQTLDVGERVTKMKDLRNGLYKNSMKLERRTASLYVQNTGSQQCAPNYGWGPGVRDHFLLHHVIAGSGVFACGDRRYALKAGDTFLIYPNTTIHYCAAAQEPWEYVWVGFSGLDAAAYVELTDFSPQEPVLCQRSSREIRELMEAVYHSCGPSVGEELTMTARLYELVAFLVRTADGSRGQPREQLDCAQLAAEYIIDHYETPITVEGLADYASVSHSSLYRRFVKRYQMSPKRFLLEYRIQRACVLLTTTSCSIQEISNSVGFEDPFYFSRVFKEIKGVSPRQYAGTQREE